MKCSAKVGATGYKTYKYRVVIEVIENEFDTTASTVLFQTKKNAETFANKINREE